MEKKNTEPLKTNVFFLWKGTIIKLLLYKIANYYYDLADPYNLYMLL